MDEWYLADLGGGERRSSGVPDSGHLTGDTLPVLSMRFDIPMSLSCAFSVHDVAESLSHNCSGAQPPS